jgi:hypothetical protein
MLLLCDTFFEVFWWLLELLLQILTANLQYYTFITHFVHNLLASENILVTHGPIAVIAQSV